VAAKAEIAELAHVRHVFVKASARLNNRAENSHQPTRERERRMRGSAILNARRLSYRASVRSGSTSRSSDIYCAPRSIGNNSPHASTPGIASLGLPEIRPLSDQMRVLSAIASQTL
jgi:putative transposase